WSRQRSRRSQTASVASMLVWKLSLPSQAAVHPHRIFSLGGQPAFPRRASRHRILEFAAQSSRRIILELSANNRREGRERLMSAFLTGGTGFIGKRLVRRLLERDGEPVYLLVYQPTAELVAGLKEFWGAAAERVSLIEGDISKPDLGVSTTDAGKLEGKIDHFFHLAAVYDLNAPPAQVVTANVAGVANALAFAKTVKAGCFHHVSSIAAAGLYDRVFREDMLEEARGLEHPYYSSKHKGEGLVRAEKGIAWRVYRPGIVVGDSRTGEIDKID